MVLYEMEVKVKWQAKVKDVDGKEISISKGNYNMPALDTVDAIDEFEITVELPVFFPVTTLPNLYLPCRSKDPQPTVLPSS